MTYGTKRILIVEPHLKERTLLQTILQGHPQWAIVGNVADPYKARDLVVLTQPDLILLALNLPRLSGLEFMEILNRFRPTPIIAFSQEPSIHQHLREKVRALGGLALFSYNDLFERDAAEQLLPVIRSSLQIQDSPLEKQRFSSMLIGLGASTGGTEAILEVLQELPENFPPIFIVQHMPLAFTKPFADRLDRISRMHVVHADKEEPVIPGFVYLAQGDRHLQVKKTPSGFMTTFNDGEPVNRHRPSVDMLFYSLAALKEVKRLGVLLTGMGDDGAAGLLAMHGSGALTLAQDRESCAVFGMPREAIARGAVDKTLPLSQMAAAMMEWAKSQSKLQAVG